MSIHWLIIQALTLEALGISGLTSDLPMLAKVPLYVTSHGASSGLLTLVLWRLLPERYRSPKNSTLSFLFLFQFLIPFMGSLGLFSAFLLALYLPRIKRQVPWKNTEIVDLPYQATDLDMFPVYSHGGLIQILKDAADPNKRLKAVMSSKQMPEKAAIGLLKFALKDTIDDVRLLAYSMLDDKEQKLSEKISHYLLQLEKDELTGEKPSDEQAHKLHQLLASDYWEMIYLDLVQGGVRNHVLKQAQKHIELALEFKQQISSLKLYGRILLAKKEFDEAKTVFEKAIEQKIPLDEVSPFLAEIAFEKRDFKSIPGYLSIYRRFEKSTPAFQPVIHYWLASNKSEVKS